jgi:hypothetical protein
MRATSTVVRPTYDRDHYLTRAQYYAKDAEREPDTSVRAALQVVERECRRIAEQKTA